LRNLSIALAFDLVFNPSRPSFTVENATAELDEKFFENFV
jgi:hypothetical protein